jgi:hypothetical protein
MTQQINDAPTKQINSSGKTKTMNNLWSQGYSFNNVKQLSNITSFKQHESSIPGELYISVDLNL